MEMAKSTKKQRLNRGQVSGGLTTDVVRERLDDHTYRPGPPKGAKFTSDIWKDGIQFIYEGDNIVKHWYCCRKCDTIFNINVGNGNAILLAHVESHKRRYSLGMDELALLLSTATDIGNGFGTVHMDNFKDLLPSPSDAWSAEFMEEAKKIALLRRDNIAREKFIQTKQREEATNKARTKIAHIQADLNAKVKAAAEAKQKADAAAKAEVDTIAELEKATAELNAIQNPETVESERPVEPNALKIPANDDELPVVSSNEEKQLKNTDAPPTKMRAVDLTVASGSSHSGQVDKKKKGKKERKATKSTIDLPLNLCVRKN